MIERGDGLGLALEAAPPLRRRHLRRKHLQGDFARKLRVLGDKNLSHAASSELLEDVVVG